MEPITVLMHWTAHVDRSVSFGNTLKQLTNGKCNSSAIVYLTWGVVIKQKLGYEMNIDPIQQLEVLASQLSDYPSSSE